jgi:carbon monoxide dehydrogenase subunit G
MQSPTEIEAKISAHIGPIRSSFATRIVLSDINPPEGYTLNAEGKGVAGFGRGTATVSLTEEGGATVLKYNGQMSVGGKLAQVGSRLVETATRSYADQFFESFSKQFAAAAAPAEPAPSVAESRDPAPGGALSPRGWWLIAAVVVVGLGIYAVFSLGFGAGK